MIVARLRQLARLRHRIERQRFGLAGAGAFLGALLLVGWIDVRYELPWIVRFGVLLAVVAVVVKLLRQGPGALAERETARLIESAHPELGQSVRTAAQIAPALSPARPPIESELVEQAGQRVAPLPLDKELGSRRQLAPFALAVAILGICWIAALCFSGDWRVAAGRVLGLPVTYTDVKATASPEEIKAGEAVRIVATVSGRPTSDAVVHLRTEGEGWRQTPMTSNAPGQFDVMLAGLAKPLEFYVSSGDGRSETAHVAVYLPPRLVKIVTHLDYPSYLGLAPVEQTSGDVEAVEGTKATFDLGFDRPILDVHIVFSDGTTSAVTIEKTRVSFEFQIPARERTWRVAGRDLAGVAFETPPHRANGSVDLPPVIKLAEPRGDVEVTALQELITRVQAKDDHGLASVGIVLQVGAKTETLLEKKFDALDVRQAAEMAVAFLEKYPLTINDSLLVYAYATDHKPREGARIVSPLAAVDIREFKRLWREAKEGSKEAQCQGLLEKIISLQRRIYSDTTQLSELSGNREVPKALVLPLIPRQQAVIEDQRELQKKLDEFQDPDMHEMQETARHISELMAKVVASLQALRLAESCTGENVTLNELLTLRRQMIYKFGKKSGDKRMAQARPPDEKAQRPTLTQLAEKLEAAAREEQAVAAQTQAVAPGTETPAALRRQQEAAAGDVEEIQNELDANPGATELTRERAAQAEALMNAASKEVNGTRAQAGPALARSEAALRELAAHLRLLDRAPDESALARLEQRAEKAAECLAGCAKCAQGAGGKTAGGGADGQAGAANPKGQTPAGQGSAAGPHGETPAAFAAKVEGLSEQARTLDDALRHWAGDADGTTTAGHPALGRIAGAQKTEQLGKELAALAQALAKPGDEGPAGDGARNDLAKQAAKLSARHTEIAAALRQEREALRQTRAQQLTELKARVQQIAGDNFVPPPDARAPSPEPSSGARTALARNLPGENTTQLIDDLRASGDVDLGQWADALQTNRKRPILAWRALRLADRRLATILTDLKRVAPVAVRESAVPEEYRRLVESYFRALSDDFGNEAGEQATGK